MFANLSVLTNMEAEFTIIPDRLSTILQQSGIQEKSQYSIEEVTKILQAI
jgi:hypothetical protein